MLVLLLLSLQDAIDFGLKLWIKYRSLVLPKEVNVVFGHLFTKADLRLLPFIFLFVFFVLYWFRFAGSHHLLDDDVV